MYLSEKSHIARLFWNAYKRSHPLQRSFLLISSDFFLKYPSLLCCVFQVAMEQGSMMAHRGLKNSDLPFIKTIQAVPADGCPHYHAPEVT